MIRPDAFGQPPVSFGYIDVRDVARVQLIAAEEAELSGRRIIPCAGMLPVREVARLVRKNYWPSFGAPLIFEWPRALVEVYRRTHPYPARKMSSLFTSASRMEQTARGVRFDGSLAERLLGGYTPTEATIVDGADSFIALGLAEPIRSSAVALYAGAGVAVAAAAAAASIAALRASSSRS